jgi:hypothetical protein
MSTKKTPIPPPPARLASFEVLLMRERVSLGGAMPQDYRRVPVLAGDTLEARRLASAPGWHSIAVCRPGDPPSAEEVSARHREVEARLDPSERLDPWERMPPSWPVG